MTTTSTLLAKRYLGIDPGSRITGYGIIDAGGGKHRHVESGCIRMSSGAFPERLKTIFEELSRVIEQYKPDVMAVEEVFVSQNPSSALKLGQARGAAICAGAAAQLEVAEYSATHIKKTVVGRGRADKHQVQHMVRVLLNLQGSIQADAADALAVALTHAQTDQTQSRTAMNLHRRSS